MMLAAKQRFIPRSSVQITNTSGVRHSGRVGSKRVRNSQSDPKLHHLTRRRCPAAGRAGWRTMGSTVVEAGVFPDAGKCQAS